MDVQKTVALFAILLIAHGRQETDDEQMMADFAAESYRAPGVRRPIHGHNVHPASQLVNEDGSTDGLLAPEHFALFVNDSNEVVLSLRGTLLSEGWGPHTDGEADVTVTEGKYSESERAQLTTNTMHAVQRQFPDHSIILVGHSLGGTEALLLLAQDVRSGVASDITAVYTFNEYCDSPKAESEWFLHEAMTDPRAHCCFVRGDMLSNNGREHAQRFAHDPLVKPQVTKNPFDLETNHSIKNFTSSGYARPGW